jgi:tripartite-type tricarboxylate transporter receptor subunit TctC
MSYHRKTAIIGLLASILCLGLSVSAATADPVADYYHAHPLQIIVGAGAGGGYDANARLVAAHYSRFIPGNPSVVVVNKPGGGGIAATNFLYNIAPRDGSTLGTFSNSMLSQPLLGTESIRFDSTKFSWIGSVAREDYMCIASNDAGVRTWDDALKKDLIVGTNAPGQTTFLMPAVLRTLLGAKFRLVSGYVDASQITLALERGEVQAICQTWSSLRISHSDWFSGRMIPFVALGFDRISTAPDVPTAIEIAKTAEQKSILKLMLAPALAGRPITAPPEVPADRLTALREGFRVMTKDPAFLDQAQKMRIEVQPTYAEGMTKLLADIYATPKGLVAKLAAISQGSGN